MTEPDEALLWAREQCATDCDERGFSHVAERYRRGACDNLFEGDARAYRAGAAASAERIKALEARVAELEAEFDEGPICQTSASKSEEPQTSDRAALEALILVVERDGHDGSHLEDDDGQNECPVCATVATIRALLKDPDQ